MKLEYSPHAVVWLPRRFVHDLFMSPQARIVLCSVLHASVSLKLFAHNPSRRTHPACKFSASCMSLSPHPDLRATPTFDIICQPHASCLVSKHPFTSQVLHFILFSSVYTLLSSVQNLAT